MNNFYMRIILIAFILTMPILSFAQQRVILTWDFFKFDKPMNSKFDAVTHTNMLYKYRIVGVNGQKATILFEVLATVDTTKSYFDFKKKYNSLELLKHEQGHLDIVSIYAPKLQEALSKSSYLMSNFKKVIQEIYNKYDLLVASKQNQYDLETNHGTDKAKQIEWDNYFKKELNIK